VNALLSRLPESVNTPLPGGRLPLVIAVEGGDEDLVKFLIAVGANPNGEDSSGKTPLKAARARKRAEILEVLVRAGADR
jgi:ankyrin repeat protein